MEYFDDDKYALEICKNCGKQFVPAKGHPNKVYCCNDCYIEYRKKNGYMQEYYKNHTDKWKTKTSTREFKDRKNALRRMRYATDEEYRDRLKAQVRLTQQRHPDTKLNQRMRAFGITADDYYKILEAQHGKCAICGSEVGDSTGRRLYVDHDHATGEVRGLLCSDCNFGIGKFHDSPELLRNAIKYLEEGPA